MIESLGFDINYHPTSLSSGVTGEDFVRRQKEIDGTWKYLGCSSSDASIASQHEIVSNLDKHKYRVGRTFDDGVVSYWIWGGNG